MPRSDRSSITSNPSPIPKSTAKYSNKDGSKFITVRKPSIGSESTSTHDLIPQSGPQSVSTNIGQGTKASDMAGINHGMIGGNTPGVVGSSTNGAIASTVNRKKQKRRQKQAARAAAERHPVPGDQYNGPASNGHVHLHHGTQYHESEASLAAQQEADYADPEFDEQDLSYSDDEYRDSYYDPRFPANGQATSSYTPSAGPTKRKSKKKKKGKSDLNNSYIDLQAASSTALSTPSASQIPPPPPPSTILPKNSHPGHSTGISKDRIWNTSTAQERENIKEFWLQLGEEDRRSLVKVEKEAVLRKMKEQQKHSCSCTVCGRKRTAIEEELEVLYDAYYEELEQYANHQQPRLEDGTPLSLPPTKLGPPGPYTSDGAYPLGGGPPHASKGRIMEELGDEDEFEDGESYDDSYEEEDEPYSDEEPDEEPNGPAADFFNFGNSLTVQGGILTVADDLLKNDGKKFIEMMEQLAERRMQREEEAQMAAHGLGHPSMGMHSHAGHNHPPPPDDEEYEEDEEDEYDSQEEEEYDDEEMESMTEEQRMEEGRRMFQIFAARMFEQRVLSAYREKVAQERQAKLLEELEEESKLDVQRELKKAREAQKKKDKKKQQKQAKEEERARREAEKAAEEAAAKAIEEKKAEELRQKKDEQRKKREAEKKAAEEEKQRKEAERARRMQEERERQAEVERKQREQKERERKRREETKKKEREEREAKEREARERKERELQAKSEKDTRERMRKEEQASAKRQPPNAPAPPGLHPPAAASPHPAIALPAIPKAPTPVRPRQASQQESASSSPRTPQVTQGLRSSASPAIAAQPTVNLGPIGPPGKGHAHPQQQQEQGLGLPEPTPMFKAPQGGLPDLSALRINGMPAGQPPVTSMALGPAPTYSHQQIQQRPYGGPNGMPMAPALNAARQTPQTRGAYLDGMHGPGQQPMNPHAGMPNNMQPYGMTMPTHSHSRQQSLNKSSFENLSVVATTAPPTQPIARPAPIQRPSSVTPQNRGTAGARPEVDDLSHHLGSSALLDDTDEPFNPQPLGSRRGSNTLRTARGFGGSPLFPDTVGKMDGFGLNTPGSGSAWGTSSIPFGSSNMLGGNTWNNSLPHSQDRHTGWPMQPPPTPYSHASRARMVRILTVDACRRLTARHRIVEHNVNAILQEVNNVRPKDLQLVGMKEMIDICDTEGDQANGGGLFTVDMTNADPSQWTVRHDGAVGGRMGGASAAPGEIGSPIQGQMAFGARPFQPGLGRMTSPSF